MKDVVIRKSGKVLACFTTGTALVIVLFIWDPYGYNLHNFSHFPILTTGFIVCAVAYFIYNIYELITRTAEIIICSKGILLRSGEFYEWNLITSVSTLTVRGYESSDEEYLILHMKDVKQITHNISDLDKKPADIATAICLFNPILIYNGHEIR